MSKKSFSLGIIVGRFQIIHSGHECMINKAVELCGEVGIFIGSSQEQGTRQNPFSYELRKKMLKEIFGDSVQIYPLPDIGVGNNSKWGDYVLENVIQKFGKNPDLLISGKETRRLNWFDGLDEPDASELYIPKSIDISSSQLRGYMTDNNFEEWKKYTNPKLWHRYDELRNMVLNSEKELNTDSI